MERFVRRLGGDAGLSELMCEYLVLIASGNSFDAISIKMNVSWRTVVHARKEICKAFGVKDRIGIMSYIIEKMGDELK